MFGRRRRRGAEGAGQAPVVFDAHGVPLGVYLPASAGPGETTRESRYHQRVAALRKTRELEHQFELRSQFCMFCSPPPS